MFNKIKNNKKLIGRVLIISLCILVSFFIIYKLSSSLFMVITGAIILLIGSLVKDPELSNFKEEIKESEKLSTFSEEVLEPSIIIEEKKNSKKEKEVFANSKKTKKKSKTIIDIENTNSYKFDEIDKKIKKSKKVKA